MSDQTRLTDATIYWDKQGEDEGWGIKLYFSDGSQDFSRVDDDEPANQSRNEFMEIQLISELEQHGYDVTNDEIMVENADRSIAHWHNGNEDLK
jgi:hypothetical protein